MLNPSSDEASTFCLFPNKAAKPCFKKKKKQEVISARNITDEFWLHVSPPSCSGLDCEHLLRDREMERHQGNHPVFTRELAGAFTAVLSGSI